MAPEPVNTEVLIVGGGPVGLTASILLADLGVSTLLVERRDGSSALPKAHYLNSRTMEIFAQFGFDAEVYEAGSPLENMSETSWYTSLGGDDPTDGRLFMRLDAFGGGALRELYERTSASRSGNLPQKFLEPRLRKLAEDRSPGRVLFEHELVSIESGDDGVVGLVRSPDGEFEVHARYAIGADGGRTVASAVGIELQGLPALAEAISIHFEADLAPWLQEDSTLVRVITRPQEDGAMLVGGFVPMGPTRWDRHSEHWHVNVMAPAGSELAARTWDDEAAIAAVRDVLKLPELPVEILGIGRWAIDSVIAERFRAGRVFLAGDAAHRHPPNTGLGLNSGIGDAHNLAWKLAAVLGGHAGDSLLDSYTTERRAVVARNVEWAMLTAFNHVATQAGWGLMPDVPPIVNQMIFTATLTDTPDGATRLARLRAFLETQRLEFQARDIEIGYDYSVGGAVVSDGSPAPQRDPWGLKYEQITRPGHRLPHAWLVRGGERIGTHALLKPGAFLLVFDEDGAGWRTAAAEVAANSGVTIETAQIGSAGTELVDSDGAWRPLCGHEPGGAVLVRPDGHVAYRAPVAPGDHQQVLSEAITEVLGLNAIETRDIEHAHR